MKTLYVGILFLISGIVYSKSRKLLDFSSLCNFESAVTNPLLMGGLGYAIYKSGDGKQKRELKELKLKKRNHFNMFYSKKSQLEDYVLKLENQIEILGDAVSYLENRLKFNSEALRSSVENFAKNDMLNHQISRKMMSKKNDNKKEAKEEAPEANDKEEPKEKSEENEEEQSQEKENRAMRKFKRTRRLNGSPLLNKRKNDMKFNFRYKLNY